MTVVTREVVDPFMRRAKRFGEFYPQLGISVAVSHEARCIPPR